MGLGRGSRRPRPSAAQCSAVTAIAISSSSSFIGVDSRLVLVPGQSPSRLTGSNNVAANQLNFKSATRSTSSSIGMGAMTPASATSMMSPASRTSTSPSSSSGSFMTPRSPHARPIVETTMFAPSSRPEMISLLQRLQQGSPCEMLESEDQCLRHRTAADSPCHWCCGHACSADKGSKCESWAALMDSSGYYGRSHNGLGHNSCAAGAISSSGTALLETPNCEQFLEEGDCTSHAEAGSNHPCHWCCGDNCRQGSSAKCTSLGSLLASNDKPNDVEMPTTRHKNGLQFDTCSVTGAHALVLTSIQAIPRRVKGYFASLLGISQKGGNSKSLARPSTSSEVANSSSRSNYNVEIKKQKKRRNDPMWGGTCSCGAQVFQVSGPDQGSCNSLCVGGEMLHDGCQNLLEPTSQYETRARDIHMKSKQYQRAICGKPDARDVLVHSVGDAKIQEFYTATCTCDATGLSYTFGGTEDYACGTSTGRAPPGCLFGTITTACQPHQAGPPVLLQTDDVDPRKLNTRVLCAQRREGRDEVL
ncbi:unnamed protein product [Amoebophrya sp. A25]|nr:unnamed protein product [Amoebophrya sp. A25]|eukprot:GSA25T00024164001.1